MSQVVLTGSPHQVVCGEGDCHQRRVFRDGKGGQQGNEEKSKMKRQKIYFRFTLIISILLGIVLPLALGVRHLSLVAITFSSVWFIYTVIMFIIVFLINPGLKIKVIRQKNPTIVRYELSDSTGEK
jgi:hypothetical protein